MNANRRGNTMGGLRQQRSVRIGKSGIALALLLVGVAGCQTTTSSEQSAQAAATPTRKPFFALPSWLGGSKPETAVESPTPVPASTPSPTMSAMPVSDSPVMRPAVATTAFVNVPTTSGVAVTTMPTTAADTSTIPGAPMSVAAPSTTPPVGVAPEAASSVSVASSAPGPTVAADPNAGVIAHKPFIAVKRWFGASPSQGAQPSVLLQQHARSDSPVPLSDYAKQPAHDLSSFPLRPTLSAAELGRRLGPPAQLADYADPWYVYRLTGGSELWLHFAQPDEQFLLAADVIKGSDDGYTRNRVFSVIAPR